MAHTHGHGGHGGMEHTGRLMTTLILTGTIFVAEVVGAVVTGSLALLVDAGHMMTDVSVLAASTATAFLMKRKPDNARTWGWARLEVITAAGGGILLLFVGLYALVEAGMRLFGAESDTVHDVRLLLFFGILGLAANIGSILVLRAQAGDNMNMRAAFLEVCNDALGSVAVIVSAVVMMTTGWDGFDAVAGAFIALLMIPRAYVLVRDAMRVLLEKTPDGLDLDEVRRHLQGVPHVIAVHDLHASVVATGMPILTAHIVVDGQMTMEEEGQVLHQLQDCLREHFPVSIPHTTFQLEPQGYTSDSSAQFHA
ncbi:cation diffusion facilitator family transporter [uncultured Bifidobacterium sp.]|uniref:cation diffusion facilitator family transporter n=1 Tax=uncultured Bifidobacterium sp. TaxID=165187 RepID=UPI0025870B3F|nr:cation diffusion facilitator family transporter [uncultured Bifidobacterium sp.]MEE0654782.1 cation diffusion facilitator family transporter [Bifidobacterium criceti]